MRSCVCVHMHIRTVHPLCTPHRCIQFGDNIQERWVWFWTWSFWSGVWGTHRQLRSKEKEKRQIWRQWKSGPSILLRSALPSQKVVLLPASPMCKWCQRATRHRQHLTKPCETTTGHHFSCRNDSSKMFDSYNPSKATYEHSCHNISNGNDDHPNANANQMTLANQMFEKLFVKRANWPQCVITGSFSTNYCLICHWHYYWLLGTYIPLRIAVFMHHSQQSSQWTMRHQIDLAWWIQRSPHHNIITTEDF